MPRSEIGTWRRRRWPCFIRIRHEDEVVWSWLVGFRLIQFSSAKSQHYPGDRSDSDMDLCSWWRLTLAFRKRFHQWKPAMTGTNSPLSTVLCSQPARVKTTTNIFVAMILPRMIPSTTEVTCSWGFISLIPSQSWSNSTDQYSWSYIVELERVRWAPCTDTYYAQALELSELTQDLHCFTIFGVTRVAKAGTTRLPVK